MNKSDVETFVANLKKAIFDREVVTVAGGEFSGDELKAVRDALMSYLAGVAVQSNADVLSFLANMKQAIRNRETVEIGGGLFSGDELDSVAKALAA